MSSRLCSILATRGHISVLEPEATASHPQPCRPLVDPGQPSGACMPADSFDERVMLDVRFRETGRQIETPGTVHERSARAPRLNRAKAMVKIYSRAGRAPQVPQRRTGANRD